MMSNCFCLVIIVDFFVFYCRSSLKDGGKDNEFIFPGRVIKDFIPHIVCFLCRIIRTLFNLHFNVSFPFILCEIILLNFLFERYKYWYFYKLIL